MITQKHDLDITPSGVLPVVNASQYDVGRIIKFYLYNDSEVYNIPVGTSVLVNGIKPNGDAFSYNATFTDNVVTVTLTDQMTVIEGEVRCELRLANGGDDIGTTNFILLVEKAPFDSSIPISETEIPAIIELARTEQYNAEAWAVGQRNGQDVPSTDPAYHNNAKYWAEHTTSSLSGLSDVDIDNPLDGQVLKYDSDNDEWYNSSENAESLSGLSDTAISLPSAGQVLTYDDVSGKWVNGSAPSTVDVLSDLSDVILTTPTDGQALLYDSTNNKWVNGDVAGSASDITYDNTGSGLTADDVQEALDEIDGNVNTLSGKAYKTDDSTDTTIASDDKIPFYDVSGSIRKNITLANVVSGAVSNPNLLDNPWFTVNQRGQSTYTNIHGYCLDRWALYGDNTQLSKTDNGVEIVIGSNSSDNAFAQNCDIGNELDGKRVTFSMICNNVLEYNTITIPTKPVSGWQVTDIITAQNGVTLKLARHDNGTFQIVIRPPKDGVIYTFRAVKMEIGNISTLSLDTYPNYATELLKCQRYCIALNPSLSQYAMVATGIGWTTTEADFVLSLPTIMRTTPVLVSGSTWVLSDGVNWKAPTSIFAISQGNNYKVLFETTGLTQGKLYLLGTDAAASPLILSADL